MIGALIGAVAPALVGGLINRSTNKSNQRQQSAINAQNAEQAERFRAQDRGFFTRDRETERRYAKEDRANDRAYLERNRVRDQVAANEATRRAVDTRGVDFAKLRNDAIAAGFNPLSAMGTAGMYSTEVNRQVVGTGGVSGSGGGGMGPTSSGMVGPSGGGNVAQFTPALSSGSFIADAVQRGVDTVFNTPPANDPLADALRTAIASDTMVRDAQSRNPRQSFGYDLTEQPAYRAPNSIGGPALSRGTSAQAADDAGMSPTDDITAPSRVPLKYHGRDIVPSGLYSDAEAFEGRYGEIAGELAGWGALIDDSAKGLRNWTDRKGFTTKKPSLSQSSRPPIRPGDMIPDGYGGFYF